MSPSILSEIDAGIGILTLNRPERHNAFDATVIDELARAIERMANDARVRVVVLSSTGKSFCAGADLDWMRRAASLPPEDNLREARELARMLRRFKTCPKPVIARVQGPAHGGGVGLLACCDIVIATFDAQFSFSEVKLGLIPATIGPHVIAAIGERHARRYMLTAERFSAREAYRIGLVHELVVDEAALDEAIGDLAEALLKNGPQAMAECKRMLMDYAARPLDDALVEDSAQRITRLRTSAEGREGMDAFLQKRPPNWIR